MCALNRRTTTVDEMRRVFGAFQGDRIVDPEPSVDLIGHAERPVVVRRADFRREHGGLCDLVAQYPFIRQLKRSVEGNPSLVPITSNDSSEGNHTVKISEFVSVDDFERTTAMLGRKLEQGGTTRYDVRVRSNSGDWLFWEINSGLTYGEDGKPVGLHVVGRDISERKRFERQQQLLVGELNHRVKNTLAIVQSLAHQTFAKDAANTGAIASFEGRLQALATAHNLLTRKSWESASMVDVVTEALAPFCVPGRCTAEGPTLMVPPSTAVALSLATHELATNAAKYGALSNDSGRVSIRWTVKSDVLTFVWREEDGPPVAAPGRKGFGSKLIKRSLAAELGGTAELDFEPSGLVCRVEAPVPNWRKGLS